MLRKLFNAIEPNSTRKWETKDQSGFTVIPYVISADYGAKTSTITAAMQSIAENTCIRFKARGNEPDYVEIQNIKGKGCSAFVGHSPGSNPVMLENNSEATCLRHDLVIHELLHVIGLWHEHQRIDRDKYIQVIYSNIAPDDWSQFAFVGKDFGATTYDLPYDYTSIMHYGKMVFSSTGGITMQTLDPKYQYGGYQAYPHGSPMHPPMYGPPPMVHAPPSSSMDIITIMVITIITMVFSMACSTMATTAIITAIITTITTAKAL
ncbi:unnamed protein product [Heligmosomoides polygyrus]|uniref:Metalloendopeptidase n=1 Tax=Heligmosomoides polygyrus TaxID=6339 RepID=A0A3P8AZS9_HELPZ|nr:unnamed protein product [Heligmosomoides polygyrus]